MNQQIIDRIKESIDPHAEVIVDGAECSLNVTVVSEAFENCNTIKRHRMINQIFKQEILNGGLHALSIKTFTPREYDK